MRPLLSLLFAFLFGICSAFGVEWKPITPAELQLKASSVEKNADAEAIFWEIKVADEFHGEDPESYQTHYLRAKIFNERGREHAKVEITYGQRANVSDIAGRTIKPDGTIVAMKKDAIFEKDVVRGKNLRIRAKSFTLPDVQPGDIIEYQWRESQTGALSNYLRLYLQRDIPVQTVRYLVKPLNLPYLPFQMKTRAFHADGHPFKPSNLQGYSTVEYQNMPAFKPEPNMPPEDELRAWLLIYYAPDTERNPDKYWQKIGKEKYAKFKEYIKVSGDIKKSASDTTASASSDDDKVRALYAWIHGNVKNINGAQATSEDRAAWKPNRNTGETFKQGVGTGRDINLLFAALATAAGLDARMALTADRSDIFFSPALIDDYFLQAEEVAIKVDGAWKFYDPSSPYLPCGAVSWREQGAQVLVTDPKQPEWVVSKFNLPKEATEQHQAVFKLSTDGALSGPVTITYTGHQAVAERARLYKMKTNEREQSLVEELKREFAEPEITNVKWAGIDDPEKPLSATFDMRLPEYVQRTGKRMFLQPAVFQRSQGARFSSSTRRYPVYFDYPWQEIDQIEIELPDGFDLDNADMPAGIEAKGLASLRVTAKVLRTTPAKLVYTRDFAFDGLLFPKENYSALKNLFEVVRDQDQHAIALRQRAGAQ